jgi:hypothetical protein
MEFFRFCPGCGRRFHIKLESKQLVSVDRQVRRKTDTFTVGARPGYGPRGTYPILTTILSEDKPIIVDVEEFQYTYKCKHCGHEWSDKRFEEHTEG